VAVLVVQIPETEFGHSDHQREPAKSIFLNADLDHLLGPVVYGIKHQRADAFVHFGFAKSGISTQVVAPEAEATGINVWPRGEQVQSGADFLDFAIAKRGHALVGAVRCKIKDKDIVLMILERGFERQQFTAARAIAVAQHDGRRATKPGKEPAFAAAKP